MGKSYRDLGFVLLALGAALGKPAVLGAGALLTSFSLLSYILSRLSASDITYVREFSPKIVFFGETATLKYIIENRKPLPSTLKVVDSVPESWAEKNRGMGTMEASIGGHNSSAREYSMECLARGIFTFGPARLEAKDPFGLYASAKDLSWRDSLVVYPRILPLRDIIPNHLEPFGWRRAQSWIYHDPLELKTSRDYLPGDPSRFIDHKGSARAGKLKTKEFDANAGSSTVICLNLSVPREPWEGVDVDLFESLVTAASSAAWHLFQKGESVGLCTNGISRPEEGFNYLAQCPPGAGSESLRCVLTSLSGLGYFVFDSFSRACGPSWVKAARSHLLILTSILDAEVATVLRSKKAGGADLMFLCRPGRAEPDFGPAKDEVIDLCGGKLSLVRLEGGWKHAADISISPFRR